MILTQRTISSRLRFFLALCTGLVLISCQGHNPAPPAEKIITRNYEKPPVTLKLSINKPEITVAETLTLTLTAELPEGYKVEFQDFPEFPEESQSFKVVRQNTSRPQLTAGNLITIRNSLQLEPFLAGAYQVPPLQVIFKSEKDKDFQASITTEPITIKVNSLLADNPETQKIADITPPVDQPLSKNTIGWIMAGIAALIISGLLVYRFYPRHPQKEEKPVVPAHLIALEELKKLLAAQLLDKGEIKIFHQGVSGILRRYIENRFGLRAPERTTEEFLTELAATPVLKAAHKLLLKKFLTHCDLVKFAEHQPAEEEIRQTIDLGRQFIEETKEIVS
ncbi:MAG: hypothetical protein KKB30_00205 [Proteobacteria bacterium]|nr:hypothetical protein [Pseudomonadota bacterium]MBU1716577.1 hypothetical protein [Pseudomonadota bacterium]